MQIDTIVDVRGNTYHVEVSVSRISPREAELISQFGGPIVETGGLIEASVALPEGGPAEMSFLIPENPRRLPDEFPARIAFSFEDFEDASLRAQAWRQAIEARVVSAKGSLLAQEALFVGSFRQTI